MAQTMKDWWGPNNSKWKITIIMMVVVLLLAAGLLWYLLYYSVQNGETVLTMDKVIELSHKGDSLTWGDFEQYQYTDVGSGLYIARYEIKGEPDYCLLVGSGVLGQDVKPMYIYLIKIKKDNGFLPEVEERIEIRAESVEEFLTVKYH